MIQQIKEESVPVVIVGNKCDLKKDRTVSKAEAVEFSDTFRIPYRDASAWTSFEVVESFHDLARQLVEKYRGRQHVERYQGRQHRKCTIL